MAGQTRITGVAQAEGSSALDVADLARNVTLPLGSIDAMVDLLAKSRLGADQESLIAGLRAALAHMRSVATEAVQGGQTAGRSGPVAACDVLAAFTLAARARARARELYYVEDLADRCPAALIADGTMLRQKLESLAEQAFQRTPRGTIRLSVTEVSPAPGDVHLRFDMNDQGGPFDPALARDSVPYPGGSNGCIPSTDGQGLCAWFTVPVVGWREIVDEPREPQGALNSGRPLLIADDQSAGRSHLAKVLGHLGFDVRICDSAEATLAFAAQHPVAAVFADTTLDAIDAISLVQAIRALPGDAGAVPVIALCGRGEQEVCTSVRAAGANAVIEKPLTIHDLRQALKTTDVIVGHGARAKAA